MLITKVIGKVEDTQIAEIYFSGVRNLKREDKVMALLVTLRNESQPKKSYFYEVVL
jgi:hypothetical protein